MDGSAAVTRVGDERSMTFEAFYRAAYAQTVRLARLLSGSTTAAEDLAQESLLRLQPRFESLERPMAYLQTTTVNVCRSWHRSRTREQARIDRLDRPALALEPQAEELLDVIERLPYRQRSVLVLRYWLDLSEERIAEIVGCRPGTVKSIHARALDRLRKEVPT